VLGYAHPYIVWVITVPAWGFSLYKGSRTKKIASASSHFDKISGWLWFSFGLTVFILVGFGYKINFQLNPVILIVSAIPTFVSGVILKFKPLVFGGICFWIFGIISFLVSVELQPLVGAIAMVCAYLIPGYLLRKQEQ
jgi:hypothetical protein